MKLDQHYVDPRLVALYDIENPRGADTDFYLALAARLKANLILDLGCGTGLLTRELATAGRQVIGVDPAVAMLAYARRQPGAERVEWVEGDSSALGKREADLLVMTGNVAQVFLDDEAWQRTLQDIHAALRVGGYVAFESRNPDDRGWERWNPESTFQRIDSPFGPLESWLEVINVSDGKVHFKAYNHFLDSGEKVLVDSELRFRSLTEITDSLNRAGFTVETVYGHWDQQPFNQQSRLMIFTAVAR